MNSPQPKSNSADPSSGPMFDDASRGTQCRLGADIGGTFTDIVMAGPDGSIAVRKVASTPDDFGRAILAGLHEVLSSSGVGPAALEEVVHATTIATNAVLERRGAPTALITTKGFRDVLELRRARAPHLYDLHYRPPEPLVERRMRMEVAERIGPTGDVIRDLDEMSVHSAIDRIQSAGIEAVAVCLIHSYQNPGHERRIGEHVRARATDIFCSLSVDVLPEINEYERTSTTVINAYVGPLVGKYLRRLSAGLRDSGVQGPLRVMQSNGGIISVEGAAARPAQIVESGPAAGVVAAARLAERANVGNLITVDMGGTTAKASVIEDGRPSVTTEFEVGSGISLSSRLTKGAGYALRLPVLDLAEVGAGGGSIASVDAAGSLRVGPESAGAVPGPACYGAGGDNATVTDANVALGYLNPTSLAGGALAISVDRAKRAVSRDVAKPLGVDLHVAAYGIFTVAVATMARAVKAVSTYRGRDPRHFSLLVFGGNGPVFGTELARFLGMKRVLVPPAAGIFSAVGLIEAGGEHHFVQTLFSPLAALSAADLRRAIQELRRRADVSRSRGEGWDGPLTFDASADLRYRGQAYSLTVPVPTGPIASKTLVELADSFEHEHELAYGHVAERAKIDLVNVRLVVSSPRPRLSLHLRQPDKSSLRPAGTRLAYFGRDIGFVPAAVLARGALRRPTKGPVIVEEYDATTVVPPGCVAVLDDHGNVQIDVTRDVR